MKKYQTNEAVVHAWRIQERKEGSNKNGSIFFEEDTIYSYGYHFPLAIKRGNLCLINRDKYSKTTSKHQALVRRETFGLHCEEGDTRFLRGVTNE